ADVLIGLRGIAASKIELSNKILLVCYTFDRLATSKPHLIAGTICGGNNRVWKGRHVGTLWAGRDVAFVVNRGLQATSASRPLSPQQGRESGHSGTSHLGQFQKSANFIQSLRRRRLSSDNRRIMLTLETASSIGTAKAFANRQLYFALEYLDSPAGTVLLSRQPGRGRRSVLLRSTDPTCYLSRSLSA
ncbi:MAG: hypothetical protein WB677_26465, partial [Xanthobacteraceae bacterium]